MTEPVAFLIGLGQTLANMGLYGAGHPSRERAIQTAYESLGRLLAAHRLPSFTFIDGEAVFDRRVLVELKEWEWSTRLAALGIERIEFVAPVERGEFQEFLIQVHERLKAADPTPLPPRSPETGIRFGSVALGGESLAGLAGQVVTTTVPFDFTEEIEGIRWIHERVADSDTLPVVETETIVRSLSLALRHEGQIVLSLLELATLDHYAVTHAYNTAILAMGLGEYLGYAMREVRALGIAAMLHDLGNVRVPAEALAAPGPLSEEARRLMQTHPVEGARLILTRHSRMELAAVVAYEHHHGVDGSGYPPLLWPREPHFASRLVRVCDVYDALLSARPWRPARSQEEALGLLLASAGREFDADLVQAFSAMVRQARIRPVAADRPVVDVEGAAPGP